MKISTVLKRIAAITAVLAMVLGGAKLLNYILVNDAASYSRLMMHEFYTREKIDLFFVGASHSFRSINPAIIEENTGKTAFVAGSANQTLDTMYALIKEAIELYHPEVIYVEVSQSLANEAEDFQDRDEGSKSIVSLYLITDYMKLSKNKLSLILNATPSEHYINSFWPARRYWEKIFNFTYVENQLNEKSTNKYKNYSYYFANYGKENTGQYIGNGHSVVYSGIDPHMYFTKEAFSPMRTDEVSVDWQNTLLNIIDYCNDHGTKVVLFDAPVSNYYLASLGNYDDYIAFLRNLIAGRNAEYVEFNLLSDTYFPYNSSYYSDGNHLNADGAYAFSLLFSDYLNNDLPDEAFHATVADKLSAASPDYYGISYRYNKSADVSVLRLIANRSDYFEYKVETERKETGEVFLIQDYSTNDLVEIPLKQIEHAWVIVTFRPAGSNEEGIRIVY